MLCMGAPKSHVTKLGHVIAPKTETVVRAAITLIEMNAIERFYAGLGVSILWWCIVYSEWWDSVLQIAGRWWKFERHHHY